MSGINASHIGSRVAVASRGEGVLAFYSPTDFKPGVWAGVCLDTAVVSHWHQQQPPQQLLGESVPTSAIGKGEAGMQHSTTAAGRNTETERQRERERERERDSKIRRTLYSYIPFAMGLGITGVEIEAVKGWERRNKGKKKKRKKDKEYRVKIR